MFLFAFQYTNCQKLEMFRAMKHHLEDLMTRKTNIAYDYHPDFKSMIQNPIFEWETEAMAAIENGTKSLMESFRLTSEAIQQSTESVKADIEIDKKTKKT